MQILLTKEEYDALVEAPKKIIEEKDAIIIKLCRMINNESPKGGVCPIDNRDWGVCDDCPVEKFCVSPYKDFSE